MNDDHNQSTCNGEKVKKKNFENEIATTAMQCIYIHIDLCKCVSVYHNQTESSSKGLKKKL